MKGKRLALVGLAIAVTALPGCNRQGSDNRSVTAEPPNHEACELLRSDPGESTYSRDRANRVIELANEDLAAALLALQDFEEQSNLPAGDNGDIDLEALRPILEASAQVTALCARAGVVLPLE